MERYRAAQPKQRNAISRSHARDPNHNPIRFSRQTKNAPSWCLGIMSGAAPGCWFLLVQQMVQQNSKRNNSRHSRPLLLLPWVSLINIRRPSDMLRNRVCHSEPVLRFTLPNPPHVSPGSLPRRRRFEAEAMEQLEDGLADGWQVPAERKRHRKRGWQCSGSSLKPPGLTLTASKPLVARHS